LAINADDDNTKDIIYNISIGIELHVRIINRCGLLAEISIDKTTRMVAAAHRVVVDVSCSGGNGAKCCELRPVLIDRNETEQRNNVDDDDEARRCPLGSSVELPSITFCGCCCCCCRRGRSH